MNVTRLKLERRERRKKHVRKSVFGTSEKPRLTVFRSQAHIYCQMIDDVSGRTLASASTLTLKKTGVELKSGSNKGAAALVGKAIAEVAKAKGLNRVVFDRNGFKYHGRVKSLADAARKGGLTF